MDGAVAHAVMLLATSGSKSSRIADSGQSALHNMPAVGWGRDNDSQ